MQVDTKTDKLKECVCGYKPDHYTIGYGLEPMSVFCPNCVKQTKGIGGPVSAVIDYWNNTARHIKKKTDKHEFV